MSNQNQMDAKTEKKNDQSRKMNKLKTICIFVQETTSPVPPSRKQIKEIQGSFFLHIKIRPQEDSSDIDEW